MTSDYLDRPTRSLKQLAAELRERIAAPRVYALLALPLYVKTLRRVEAEIAARKAP